MNRFQRLFDEPDPLSFAVLIALHYLLIQLSFICGKTPENEVIIWLPNAVLLVALLRFKWRAGALMCVLTYLTNVVANLPSATLDEAALLSLVNLIEVGIACMIMRGTRTSARLTSMRDLSNFIVAGPVIGAFVSGLLGAAVISAYGAGTSYLTLMRVWWFDDGLGLLIVAPILMLASTAYPRETVWRFFDVLFLLVIAGLLALMYYALQSGYKSSPLTPTLVIPFALMLSLRFRLLWSSIGVMLISLAVSRMVAMGLNPFGDADFNHLVIHTQEFILTISMICMGSSVFVQQLRSHERELEDKVAARTAELAANLIRLKNMQEELIQSAKLASLGTLVAGMAHELNTPIGISIMAASTLKLHVQELCNLIAHNKLKRSELNGFVANLVEVTNLIERNIARAGELVSTFKQVAVDQASERLRKFDLQQVIVENMATLMPVVKEKNLDLQIYIPYPIQFESYPGPLGQIVSSLVNNALLHAFTGKSSGQILIRARCENNLVLLEIIDDGIGMEANVAARVFDPFYTTRMGVGSSGLGLYIVNNIVVGVLGGSIALKSVPQQGTHFKLSLPLRAPDVVSAEFTRD